MLWLATAELAAAVTNAGALGVISPLGGMDRDGDPEGNLDKEIEKTRDRTRGPFGVNIPLDLPYAECLVALAIRRRVPVVITAAGNPALFSSRLKSEGIRVVHVVSSVRQAQKAESCEVDAVVAEGVEAAAHIGADELALVSLIPQVADAVAVPVIAAGGICDARGLVAAFALGAEGVQLGTRFVAVEECVAHRNYKQAIIAARDTDTLITRRGSVPTRTLKTAFSIKVAEMERAGVADRDIAEFIGYRSNRLAQIDGDLDRGEAYSGSSAGMIKEVVAAREVIERLVEGYDQVLKKLIPQKLTDPSS